MPDNASTSPDDDLLARLNALKKSSVGLNTTHHASVASSRPADDLATRFARLGSASPSASVTSNQTSPLIVAPGAPSYLEGIAHGIGGESTEFNEEDEKSLEELLAELNGAVGDRKDWDISIEEQQDVGKLLEDMKRILPEVVNSRAKDPNSKHVKSGSGAKEEAANWESIEVNIGSGQVNPREENTEDDGDEDQEGKRKTEDDEADDVIAKVMAELDIRRKYGPPSPPSGDDASNTDDHENKSEGDNTNENFALPSAPTDLPEDDLARTQAIEDAFTARLAALSAPSSKTDSLGLPSAPSFAPKKKPPVSSNLQSRIDDEVDTWCIICQDDATLRCLGCDGDLYCQKCWKEGHRGESAGFEERMHKAVLYAKKKKQPA